MSITRSMGTGRRALLCLVMMTGIVTFVGFGGTAFAQEPAPPAPASAAAPTNPKAAEAKAALDAKDAVGALKALIEMHRTNPDAWRGNVPLIDQVYRAVIEEAETIVEKNNPDRALALAELMGDKTGRDLFSKIYTDEKLAVRMDDLTRKTYGNAYWLLGSRAQIRGNREESHQLLNKSTTYLKSGDRMFARVCATLGSILMDKGAEAVRNKDFKNVNAMYEQAAICFIYARDNAGNEKSIHDVAVNALAQIAAMGLQINAPGMPTPIPAATATPESGIGGVLSGSGKVGSFISGLTKDRDAQQRGFIYLALIFGFIIFYWVIPTWLMRRTMLKGNVRAAELLPKVKFLGPFTFLGLISGLKFERKPKTMADTASKQPCPNCGFNLGDMFAYEDLVFSRCPKCKAKISPLFTVEAYIQQLSNSLGTDVEKVNIGMISMEKHVAKDAVVRLVTAIITLGVRRRASDIHIEPDEEALHIRQRIDGVMTEMCRLPRSLAATVVSALKVQGGMNIAEKRLPQDGKFQIRVDKTDIDVRAASSPTGTGEKVSLRILDVRSIQMETKHLGMPPQMQAVFESVIHQPHGMMLITGPTGSGKTTTIYVALQSLKSAEKNIISIEDPIEFRIPGVNQIQVNTAAGLSFASGLRSILRQDPDVIVIGEIRDKETAEIAVNSSTTGHMVFSTLHTVDASSSVARLIDLGVSPRQFADALSLIVAQRLIRLACQYCKHPFFPDDNSLKELGLNRVLVDGFDFQQGKGCEVCNNTGYYRRTGIFEFLSPSERLRSALEAGGLSTSQIRDIAVQGGMRTLRQEAIVLMQQGMTTTEETIRVTK